MTHPAGNPLGSAVTVPGDACAIPMAAMLAMLLYVLDSFVATAVGAGLMLLGLSMLSCLVSHGLARARGKGTARKCRIGQFLIFLATGFAILLTAVLETRSGDADFGRVIIAVEDYHAAQGTYPDRLTQLVPDYLAALPRASWRFGQGEFIYRVTAESPYLIRPTALPAGRITYRFSDQLMILDD